MCRPDRLKVIIALMIGMVLTSCGGKAQLQDADNRVLVWVGDSALYEADVVRKIPVGLNSADSSRMFHNIVDSWVKERLLLQLASENLGDLTDIERRVSDYRNRLIVAEYIKEMTEGHVAEVTESDVKDYFKRFGSEMVLEHPLVKGVYLKVAEEAERLNEVKGWVSHPSRESIDRLEKYGLKEAMHYDYFMNRWVDWTQIADQIPYSFGNPDEFLATHRNFETTHDGAVYVLHVAKYLPSGEKMPYSFAATKIREALWLNRQADFEEELTRSLYKKAQTSGQLKLGIYNPVTATTSMN